MNKIGGIDTIRVGIPRDNPHYHGRLAGRTITVGDTVFAIVECPLRELHEFDEANAARCHFVLTDATSGEFVEAELARCEMTSNGKGRGWRHYIGGREMCASWSDSRKEWTGKNRPTPGEIVRAIGVLTRNVRHDKFVRWLETMTPDGWYLAAM